MPAPASVDEFVDLIQKSGVLDEKRLKAFLQHAAAAYTLPDTPEMMAKSMVDGGVLTNFQAEQFLLGKWRRFNIGNYKVLERLGSGGMGNVYLCEHKVMRRRVAIKVLASVSAEDPSSLKRFHREARAAAALDHPNIVRTHDIGQEDKLHFLIMDYVDGSSLEQVVRGHGPLDLLRAIHYISQAATGLQFAHDAGLIHRDIKPGNLILDRSGTVKVLDMGVARFCQEEDEVLTKGPLGTADYLAPEQARDSHGVDFRADIYSLGATFYFLLTGASPFGDGKSVAQKILLLQTKEPRPIRELRPDAPEELSGIIENMMAKDPERYQTMTDVVQELAPWTQMPIPPPTDEEMPRLCPAALGTDGTDVNIGMTPMPGTGPSSGLGLGRKGPAKGPAPAAKAPPVAQNAAPPARKNPSPPAGKKASAPVEKAPPAEPEPSERSSTGTVVMTSVTVSAIVTAIVAVGIWWFFIRPGH